MWPEIFMVQHALQQTPHFIWMLHYCHEHVKTAFFRKMIKNIFTENGFGSESHQSRSSQKWQSLVWVGGCRCEREGRPPRQEQSCQSKQPTTHPYSTTVLVLLLYWSCTTVNLNRPQPTPTPTLQLYFNQYNIAQAYTTLHYSTTATNLNSPQHKWDWAEQHSGAKFNWSAENAQSSKQGCFTEVQVQCKITSAKTEHNAGFHIWSRVQSPPFYVSPSLDLGSDLGQRPVLADQLSPQRQLNTTTATTSTQGHKHHNYYHNYPHL